MREFRLFSYIIIPLLGLFCSCSQVSSVSYHTQDVANLFSLEIPSYLEATDELNKDADCQFQNREKDFCMLIRKNDWAELQRRRPSFVLEDFYDVSIEQLKGSMEKINAPAPDSISLNGLPTFLGTLSGDFKGDRITVNIGTIAGANYLYQLLIWTKEEERELYKPDIDRLILSFQETEIEKPVPIEPIESEEIQSDQPSQP